MLENKLFEALLDVIPFKAYAVDIETYEVIYANKLMRENMYAPQEQYCWEQIFGQEQICAWCSINKLHLKDKKNKEKLVCEFFDESDDIWIKTYDELVSWPDGRDVKYSILVDITDQKEIQGNMIQSHAKLAMHSKQLKQTNKNLQITKLQLQKTINALEEEKSKALNATESKSKFLAHMSHEIRTPINAVIGMSHLLSQTKLNPQQQNYLQKIELSSKNLFNIINNILDFSKVEAGKVTLEHIHFNIKDFLNDIKNIVEFKAAEKNLTITIHTQLYENNTTFYGDSFRIGQILINLLSNAIKFTQEGAITVLVQSSANNRITFDVQDTGIGLTPQELKNLFQSFSQAHSSTSRKFGGTGLGLTISHQLAVLMDGDIHVESQKDVGSHFILDISLQKGDVSKIEQSNSNEFTLLEEQMSSVQMCHILLAEDNSINQEIIIALLKPFDIHIDIASNGQEAIDLFAQQPQKYTLILMDIQMPIVNGYEAIAAIRHLNEEVPIIALSANTLDENFEKASYESINAYINKPIDIVVLYKTLLNIIKPSYHYSKHLAYNDTETTLKPLMHIDIKKGVRHFLHNENLYVKILHRFYDDYKHLNLSQLDKETLFQTLHTLKGLSANIGAMKLYEAIIQYEQKPSKQAFHAIELLMNAIIEELKNLDDTLKKEDKSDLVCISDDQAKALFEQLKSAVKSRRPKECTPILEELKQYKLKPNEEAYFQKLCLLIEAFEYDEALKLWK